MGRNGLNILTLLVGALILHSSESDGDGHCEGIDCSGHGSCTEISNGYLCNCTSPYNGNLCESVHQPVLHMWGYNSKGEVITDYFPEEEPVTMECHYPVEPPPDMIFLLYCPAGHVMCSESKNSSNSSNSTSSHENGVYWNSTVVVMREDNNRKWHCRVSWNGQTYRSTEHTLNVSFNAQAVTLVKAFTEAVTPGSRVFITCETDVANPPTIISWRINENVIEKNATFDIATAHEQAGAYGTKSNCSLLFDATPEWFGSAFDCVVLEQDPVLTSASTVLQGRTGNCASVTCNGNGECLDLGNHYICDCFHGSYGRDCKSFHLPSLQISVYDEQAGSVRNVTTGYVNEGKTVKLECSYPVPPSSAMMFSLHHGGASNIHCTETVSYLAPSTSIIGSDLCSADMVMERELNTGRQWTCQITWRGQTYISLPTPLRVQFAASTVDMIQPLSSPADPGDPISMRCKTDSGLPSPVTAWYRDGTMLQTDDELYVITESEYEGEYEGKYVTSRLVFQATKEMFGSVFNCVLLNQGRMLKSAPSTLKRRLTVSISGYSGPLGIGDDLLLICELDEEVADVDFSWTFSANGTGREFQVSKSQTFSAEDVSIARTGTYTCHTQTALSMGELSTRVDVITAGTGGTSAQVTRETSQKGALMAIILGSIVLVLTLAAFGYLAYVIYMRWKKKNDSEKERLV